MIGRVRWLPTWTFGCKSYVDEAFTICAPCDHLEGEQVGCRVLLRTDYRQALHQELVHLWPRSSVPRPAPFNETMLPTFGQSARVDQPCGRGFPVADFVARHVDVAADRCVSGVGCGDASRVDAFAGHPYLCRPSLFGVDSGRPDLSGARFNSEGVPIGKAEHVLELIESYERTVAVRPWKPMRNEVVQMLRESRTLVRGGAARIRRRPTVRIGWVAADTLESPRRTFRSHQPPVSMRINNMAFWMKAHAPNVRTEVYREGRRYDVVVFFKAMDAACQEAARQIQEAGGRVIFDANVNYYEISGEYDLEGTKPTEEQRRDAIAMTDLADWVVADSSYLLGVVAKINTHSSWIPDNVDLRLFRGRRRHRPGPLRLVWSGMAHKAAPLITIAGPLAKLPRAELAIVSNREPPVLAGLSGSIRCRFVPFSERRYAAELRRSDVIVSPKRLVNSYELAHSEYKITPGMAVGLPAVASPQQSYVEAISGGGGIIAADADEWEAAFVRLADPVVRAELGWLAAETVRARYSTDVTGSAYLETILALVK